MAGPLKKVARWVQNVATSALGLRKKAQQRDKLKKKMDEYKEKGKKPDREYNRMSTEAWKLDQKVKKDAVQFNQHPKDPLYCIDTVAVDAAKEVRQNTNWKGKVSYHPDSPERFDVIQAADKAPFRFIKEYRWASDYPQGRRSTGNDGGSGVGGSGGGGRNSTSCDGSDAGSGAGGRGGGRRGGGGKGGGDGRRGGGGGVDRSQSARY